VTSGYPVLQGSWLLNICLAYVWLLFIFFPHSSFLDSFYRFQLSYTPTSKPNCMVPCINPNYIAVLFWNKLTIWSLSFIKKLQRYLLLLSLYTFPLGKASLISKLCF
jgi:hypothetical protein